MYLDYQHGKIRVVKVKGFFVLFYSIALKSLLLSLLQISTKLCEPVLGHQQPRDCTKR